MADSHAFDFLADSTPTVGGFTVMYGDSVFLQQLSTKHAAHALAGTDEDGLFQTYEGDAAEWRDVNDELATVSLFGPNLRIVVVRGADKFVSKNRDALEAYAARPYQNGALILEVKAWQSNTRLAKQIKKTHLQVDCRPPKQGRGNAVDGKRIVSWIQTRSQTVQQRKISPPAAELLLEIVGTDFGRIEQELAKLALFVEESESISPELVRDMVGGWRTKSTWELADTIAAGDLRGALEQLDAMLRAGESPNAILPQLSWSLRRFAVATRIFALAEKSGQRIPLGEALEQAGFRPWPAGAIAKAEKQLRRLKRSRALRLYRWLLEADVALKSSHSDPARARFALEQLVFKLG